RSIRRHRLRHGPVEWFVLGESPFAERFKQCDGPGRHCTVARKPGAAAACDRCRAVDIRRPHRLVRASAIARAGSDAAPSPADADGWAYRIPRGSGTLGETRLGSGSAMQFNELTVMVVEDHGFQRRMAIRLLGEVGVSKVLEAADGHQALDQLTGMAVVPEVLLVDLDMPGMDGIEFIGHVAQKKLARAV